MDILSKILFIILIISPFIYIASKLMLYETYETENNIKCAIIQYFQYGLELNYFDSSDIEKIKFYLDLLQYNKQNTYDFKSIKKIIDRYTKWQNNPTIKEKWDTICNRYYKKLETLIKQCSNDNIHQYFEKLKCYWPFYGKERVDITSIFKTFKHNLIGYIDWNNHYNNIQACINEKKNEHVIVNPQYHHELQEIESINQQIIQDICNGIKIDWQNNGYQDQIFKFLMQIK